MWPKIYIGTGGYADSDLMGTLYPFGTKKEDFLTVYSQHYDTLEINSTFHAPLGAKAFSGMLAKLAEPLQFSVKLHQDFSHNRVASRENAKAFLTALQPLIEANCLANLFLQFPSQFERTLANRRYLADLQNWFENQPLAIEFRHSSWHIPPVFDTFAKSENLIWCNVDYPQHIGLPAFHFYANQRSAYLRLHGRNPNWWKGQSAAERHDYRYSEKELQELAKLLAAHRNEFDTLYLYFENTTKSHSFYNIAMLKAFLTELGFQIKPEPETLSGQQSLF
ncbi:hypothetical protein F543_4770 [Bibersteinia trehalosi USDA-ARS-USMARC-189]|uniref:DUF72 domain-containing protein n=1 Tax=Bibersteinia trehalosi USDA-ARS-USMARC-189 TaxID=1263831 RepID=A0ABN4BWW2_BIBTR|nr:DUF72 domain-containing protein [Bibersteinia trehalosi]AGH39123.1 hypothetical protein WQG_18460 [Bibersteinia trehalosi USDA-ARS-USMARC-192]AHG83341.1 hypothetical protein F543_4770 [Bibersteinia trehalosi USDA-ARS-USMARC-189]